MPGWRSETISHICKGNLHFFKQNYFVIRVYVHLISSFWRQLLAESLETGFETRVLNLVVSESYSIPSVSFFLCVNGGSNALMLLWKRINGETLELSGNIRFEFNIITVQIKSVSSRNSGRSQYLHAMGTGETSARCGAERPVCGLHSFRKYWTYLLWPVLL